MQRNQIYKQLKSNPSWGWTWPISAPARFYYLTLKYLKYCLFIYLGNRNSSLQMPRRLIKRCSVKLSINNMIHFWKYKALFRHKVTIAIDTSSPRGYLTATLPSCFSFMFSTHNNTNRVIPEYSVPVSRCLGVPVSQCPRGEQNTKNKILILDRRTDWHTDRGTYYRVGAHLIRKANKNI